jgi:hypothetical protein
MSQTERDFEESLRVAADLLEDAYGREEAIAELQSRRQPGEETPRVNAALAYLRYKDGDADA